MVLGIIATSLLVVACTSQRAEDGEIFHRACGTGLQLCADEGLIKARILAERCRPDARCSTAPIAAQPYLEFIELDAPSGEGCGPGECGSTPEGLEQGWRAGRWKVVAPAIDTFEPPEPMTINLHAREVVKVDFVYRDTE